MSRVALLAHGSLIHALEPYLVARGHEVYAVQHPLDRYDGKPTIVRHNGRELRHSVRRDRGLLGNLIVDFAWSAIELARAPRPDVIVAINNFDTLVAQLWRSLPGGPRPRLVYLASDFSDPRFGRPLLDAVYRGIERAVVRGADVVVSNSRRAEARRRELGLRAEKSVVIPNGVTLAEPRFEPKPIDKRNVAFVGSITREHGLHDLLAALAPEIDRLHLVGEGPDLARVLALCASRGIRVEHRGGLPNAEVVRFLQEHAGIGVAPYNTSASWTYYCSPLKVIEYISCGVPVLMSSVPELAATVRARGLGVTYETLDAAAIARDLAAFDPAGFHDKARAFYAEHNHDHLFARLDF